MKLSPLGAEFFNAERQTDWSNEINSRFSQFCEDAQTRSPFSFDCLEGTLCNLRIGSWFYLDSLLALTSK